MKIPNPFSHRSEKNESQSLFATLEEFINAPNWTSARRLLETRPELLSEEAEAILVQAAEGLMNQTADYNNHPVMHALTARIFMLRRCREVGVEAAIAEIEQELAGEEMREDASVFSPQFSEAMRDALDSYKIYEQSGDAQALEKSLTAWKYVLAQPEFSMLESDFQLSIFNHLSLTFYQRYEAAADLEDLNWSLICTQEAIKELQFGTIEWVARMHEMGIKLRKRFHHTGNLNDLNQAIQAGEQAVQHAPPDSMNLPISLNSLGHALKDRYRQTGDMKDLEQSIEVYERTATLTPPDSSMRPILLSGLGNVLGIRYDVLGDFADLERSIVILEEAAKQTPPDSFGYSKVLHNLSSGLKSRFRHTGDVADLKRAVELSTLSVENTPPDSPDMFIHMNGLATASNTYYDNTGDQSYLDKAINTLEKLADRTESTSTIRVGVLANLGGALHDRYMRTGVLADLERSIQVTEDSMASGMQSAPDLNVAYLNLGNSLMERYFRAGNLTDLTRAIQMWEKAVALTPLNSPGMADNLNALGNGLRRLYSLTKDSSVLERSIEAFEKAVSQAQPKSAVFSYYLNSLGSGLIERYLANKNLADLERAVEVLGQAKDRIPVKSTERPNILNSFSSALMCLYGSTQNLADLDHAIEIFREAIEESRHALPRMYSFMTNLANSLTHRWRHTNDEKDAEEAVKLFRQSTRGALDLGAEQALRSALLWGGWAFSRRAWEEAIEAYDLGQKASERLVRIQLLRSTKELWLGEAQALAAHAAYALAKNGNLQQAVVALERGRALLLTEVLERDRADLNRLKELGHLDLYENYRRITEHWIKLTRLEPQAGQPTANETTLTRELQVTRAQLDETIAAIREVPGYGDFLHPPSFSDIEAAAANGPLVYIAATEAGGLALIIRSDGDAGVKPLWLPELTSEGLLNKLKIYLTNYILMHDGSNKSARNDWFATLDDLTHWLWQTLMGDVVKALAPAPTAILIPVGLLGLLPLHAAWVEDASAKTGRRYALDQMTLLYAPNARSLSAARDIVNRTTIDALLAVDEPQPVSANPLLSSAREVEAASSTFRTKRIFKQREATRQALLEALPGYSIFHFSCHGFANFLSPLDGGLVMANDEILSLRDFLNLRLSGARLAVLSACETGIPGLKLPDEVVNLPTSFLQSGVAGIISSLWSVSDMSTMMLMSRFYELWRLDSLAPPEALRQAQIWLRDTTNGEKTAYFKSLLPEFSGDRMPSGVADVLYKVVALSHSGTRDFSPPFYWAAFSYWGV